MVGGAVMGYVGGLHFWWPKITGRARIRDRCRDLPRGPLHRFNLTFFPQFILGYLACPRRYQHLSAGIPKWSNVLSTAGASILALGYLLPHQLPDLVHALLAESPGQNPWPATGLEWKTDFTAAHGKF